MARRERIRLGVVGARRGVTFINQARVLPAVELTAVCDVDPARLDEVRQRDSTVRLFADYDEFLAEAPCDAVAIASPVPFHAEQSIKAVRAGKHVLCEVIAGETIDDIRAVVRAVEETGLTYMMAENVCYYRTVLMILNMIRRGLFGELTFAECGYIHSVKPMKAQAGPGNWRYEWVFTRVGNCYPTHAIGPVAWWMDLGRSDRMVSLVSMDSKSLAFKDYVQSDEVPADCAAKNDTRPATLGDVNKTLIQTEKGRLIDLWYDTQSNRPCASTTYFQLRGLGGSYDNNFGLSEQLYLKGRSKGWEDLWKYATEYEHPLWREHLTDAQKAGHGGSDFFTLLEFADCVLEGRRPPIDVYDAADWSAIIPLSAESVRRGGQPVQFPTFRTRSV